MSNDKSGTSTAIGTGKGNLSNFNIVDYGTEDGFPVGVPPKIKNSPNGAFYYDALRAGWSVRQLEKHAKEYFNESIGKETFHRLSKLIPPDQKIPQPIRDITLKGIDAKIDVLQSLENAVELQQYRVGIARAYEERTKDTAVIPIFMKPVREEVAQLWAMLKGLANLQTNLGLLGSNRNVPRFTGVSNKQEEARAFADTLSQDAKVKFLTMMKDLKGSKNILKISVNEAITTIDKHCSNKIGIK